MKKQISLLITLLVLMVTGLSARAAQSQQWKTYIMRDEKLSVSFPNMPAVKQSREKRDKPLPPRRKTVMTSSAAGVDYRIDVVENLEPRQSLDTFVKEAIASNLHVDAASERSLTIDGTPGKAFVLRDGKGMVQFFATEDYLYEFRAQGAPPDDAKLTNFFTSISLKLPPGVDVSRYQGDGSDEKPYTGKDVDVKVKIKSKPPAVYPASAKSERVTGTIILRCVFTAHGTVTDFRIVQGLPGGLTESAIAAAKKIKFTPAMKDGKPVSMWMQLEYNFNLF